MFSKRTNWNLQPNAWAAALQHFRRSPRAHELIDLSLSNPTEAGFRFDEKAIFAALTQAEALHYHPEPRGLLSARAAIAEYYRQHAGCEVSPEKIILTASTSEAYAHLFRLLCEPCDEVLVPAPGYPLFEHLADLNDVVLRQYRLFYDHGWQMDLHALRQQLTPRTRAILLVHPNNPTGSFASREEMQALNALCCEHEMALIADEVFWDYAHGSRSASSFAGNQDAMTFTLSGLSKICALPQMKLAWIAASGPESAVAPALERLELIADTYLSVSTPVQLAAPTLLAGARALQEQIHARIRRNLGELDSQLAAQSLCTRLQTEAGWYAILRLPVTRSDEEMAIALLQRQAVLAHPGHFFDFEADGHLILSLIVPPEVFAEGVRRLLAWVAAGQG